MQQTKKVIAIFVEGETEIEFYRALVEYIHSVVGKFDNLSFEYVNIKGIGKYNRAVLKQFRTIKEKYKCDKIYVFISFDTDVFETSKKPPMDREKIRTELLNHGAKKVSFIPAKHSIEDWFLSDYSGVLSFLKLPTTTKRKCLTGLDEIKRLFKMANKAYIKGERTEGFIAKLNIQEIMKNHCNQLKPLCKELGIMCDLSTCLKATNQSKEHKRKVKSH